MLSKLVRGRWVPDAVAQLKFSPKHKARDVSQMLNRAVSLASIRHDALPEELLVKEIVVSKGMSRKVLTIMGKGRAGFGYKRWSHVKLRVQKINFDEQILNAKSSSQKKKWIERKTLALSLRESPREFLAADLKRQQEQE
eukprot:CAMPEP_0114436788 /NCGR_PEP_ID=MMETSP0103-20121206/13650_1 /TAXON_ID=37642 ORGANISM="Paraphysomonas imperforata, Strain PA2" /NCGR_SAMPLE_ID=MMETSP0103 /ASSEMBLY_ACC=CAM_ASM_000201 /LENGTH=139 /DNA_ID=CAMNT_0001607103 /DNA_START=150 /DNA_END=569 /DNA_ORIENTATION=+